MNRHLPQALALAALAAMLVPSPARAEELLYYVKDGQIVFTNTPSEKNMKPVPHMRRGPAQSWHAALPATKYDPYIEQVARDNDVDPSLVKAVALVESGFNPKAVSNKGARGLMQLLPSTAKQYGVSDLHDPYQNLKAGAMHLRNLLDEFDGNVTLALAAYNAGSGAVRRYNGVPAYAETQNYVKKIETQLGRRSQPTARKTVKNPTKILMQVEADGSITLSN